MYRLDYVNHCQHQDRVVLELVKNEPCNLFFKQERTHFFLKRFPTRYQDWRSFKNLKSCTETGDIHSSWKVEENWDPFHSWAKLYKWSSKPMWKHNREKSFNDFNWVKGETWTKLLVKKTYIRVWITSPDTIKTKEVPLESSEKGVKIKQSSSPMANRHILIIFWPKLR